MSLSHVQALHIGVVPRERLLFNAVVLGVQVSSLHE